MQHKHLLILGPCLSFLDSHTHLCDLQVPVSIWGKFIWSHWVSPLCEFPLNFQPQWQPENPAQGIFTSQALLLYEKWYSSTLGLAGQYRKSDMAPDGDVRPCWLHNFSTGKLAWLLWCDIGTVKLWLGALSSFSSSLSNHRVLSTALGMPGRAPQIAQPSREWRKRPVNFGFLCEGWK